MTKDVISLKSQLVSENSGRANNGQAKATECWREPGFCECDSCSKPPILLMTGLNSETVKLQFCIPGCPIERHEFLQAVASLLRGTIPELPQTPICRECKSKENVCRVVYYGEICCGAMTRSGCGARCPSHGVPCAGCRGPVEEPNYDANVTMFSDRGISRQEIATKMQSFSAPVWMSLGLEKEVKHGQ